MENMIAEKSNPEVANTILAQINHFDRWARARWGYNNPSYNSDSLTFKVNGTKVGYAYVKITLDPSDTYTVEVFKFRKVKFDYKRTDFAKIEGVYDDMLVQVIANAIDGGE